MQKWITEAIREKIDKSRVAKDLQSEQRPEEMRIAIFIDEKMMQEIEPLLNGHRTLGDAAYSRKSWIIDAIKEKLSKQ